MTTPSQTPKKNALREYLIVALIIIVGTPITIWWGHKDGQELAAKAFSEEPTASAEEAQEVEGEEAEESSEVPASTPESITRGEAVFKAQCVACHGDKADGKGPAAVAFTPGPRDFTDPAAKWTVGREPAQIHETVANGIAGTGMAGFASALTAEQLWDVVHYLGSLPGVANAQ
jgi:mono/diheme cytochrome c family protein